MTLPVGETVGPDVLDNERKVYWGFASKIIIYITENNKTNDAGTIWHYTSGEKLIQIISNKEVWTTHISCLNDSTEMKYGMTLLNNPFQAFNPQCNLEKRLQEIILDALTGDSVATAGTFIACFSKAGGNDLSQWRAYGGGEGGYSIGFDVRKLALYCKDNGALIAPVTYENGLQSKIIQSVFDATIRFFREGCVVRNACVHEQWMHAFLKVWSEVLSYLGALIKHPSFEAEQEIRIIRNLGIKDVPNLKFLQRNSMMTRHLPLKFPLGLPIQKIYVGPCRNQRISLISINDLLRTYDVDSAVKVELSTIPYQTV